MVTLNMPSFYFQKKNSKDTFLYVSFNFKIVSIEGLKYETESKKPQPGHKLKLFLPQMPLQTDQKPKTLNAMVTLAMKLVSPSRSHPTVFHPNAFTFRLEAVELYLLCREYHIKYVHHAPPFDCFWDSNIN